MPKRRNVGSVDFECPNCGREYHRTLWEDVEDGCVGAIASDVVVCECGAQLLCADDYDGFDVYWLNKRKFEEKRWKLWLQTKPHIQPIFGQYYDLIRVPHGHLPVGKVFLWRRLPIPVREIRDDKYFRCPICGETSFFKVSQFDCIICWSKREEQRQQLCRRDNDAWLRLSMRYAAEKVRFERSEYFRRFWKQLECLVLPLLVLAGKAWYVRSMRS